MRTKSLPRNFTNNLPAWTMDQLATAYGIVADRARVSEPASVARTRAVNLASAIREEAFRRQFRFVLCGDGGYGYERFGGGR